MCHKSDLFRSIYIIFRELLNIKTAYIEKYMDYSSSSTSTTTLVGFRPAQLSLSILSRKVLRSAVASGTSKPQLGGEPGI
jgi:hypothetical protein